MSIITSGKCNLAIELGVTSILEHHYVLCSKLCDNVVSDPNHKLKALLPPAYDNSRYNLSPQRHFNMPKLCTNRARNTIQLSPEGEVNSGRYVPRREATTDLVNTNIIYLVNTNIIYAMSKLSGLQFHSTIFIFYILTHIHNTEFLILC